MADHPPLVSVVVTTFNRSKLVRRAIDSVLHQTWQWLELIVVDDFSTDGTAALLSEIHDPRLRTIRHEQNLGLGDARNSGIREARGKYVAFLDDDDEWLPGKLAAQVEALESVRNLAEVLVFCQVFVDDGVSRRVRPDRSIRPSESISEYLMCGEGLIIPSCVIVARSQVVETPFEVGRRRLEDYSWFLELERRGVRFELLRQPLVVWHVEMKRDRLSHVVSFDEADQWLAQWQDEITPRARRAFLAREIAPFVTHPRNRLRGARAIIAAIATRSLTATEALKAVVKFVLPLPALFRLRYIFPRRRFG